jgi:hypothetical protein
MAPMQQYLAQAQEQQYRQEFMETNKDLKGFEPLLEAVYMKLKGEGFRGQTKEAVFDKIAKEARAMIAKLPGAAKGGTATTTNNAPTKRMSTLSSGGQGGVGGTGGGDGKNTSKQIFG